MMQIKAGVFIRDRPGVGNLIGVERALITDNLVKFQAQSVISRDTCTSATELEQEETECFHLFSMIPFMTVAYDLVRNTCRLSESDVVLSRRTNQSQGWESNVIICLFFCFCS